MHNVVVYTEGWESEEWVFAHLNTILELYDEWEEDGVNLIFLGTDEANEPFITWAKANATSFRVQEINQLKFGYSSFQKAAQNLFQNENVHVLMVVNIDANSLEIVHMARNKNIQIVCL